MRQDLELECPGPAGLVIGWFAWLLILSLCVVAVGYLTQSLSTLHPLGHNRDVACNTASNRRQRLQTFMMLCLGVQSILMWAVFAEALSPDVGSGKLLDALPLLHSCVANKADIESLAMSSALLVPLTGLAILALFSVRIAVAWKISLRRIWSLAPELRDLESDHGVLLRKTDSESVIKRMLVSLCGDSLASFALLSVHCLHVIVIRPLLMHRSVLPFAILACGVLFPAVGLAKAAQKFKNIAVPLSLVLKDSGPWQTRISCNVLIMLGFVFQDVPSWLRVCWAQSVLSVEVVVLLWRAKCHSGSRLLFCSDVLFRCSLLMMLAPTVDPMPATVAVTVPLSFTIVGFAILAFLNHWAVIVNFSCSDNKRVKRCKRWASSLARYVLHRDGPKSEIHATIHSLSQMALYLMAVDASEFTHFVEQLQENECGHVEFVTELVKSRLLSDKDAARVLPPRGSLHKKNVGQATSPPARNPDSRRGSLENISEQWAAKVSAHGVSESAEVVQVASKKYQLADKKIDEPMPPPMLTCGPPINGPPANSVREDIERLKSWFKDHKHKIGSKDIDPVPHMPLGASAVTPLQSQEEIVSYSTSSVPTLMPLAKQTPTPHRPHLSGKKRILRGTPSHSEENILSFSQRQLSPSNHHMSKTLQHVVHPPPGLCRTHPEDADSPDDHPPAPGEAAAMTAPPFFLPGTIFDPSDALKLMNDKQKKQVLELSSAQWDSDKSKRTESKVKASAFASEMPSEKTQSTTATCSMDASTTPFHSSTATFNACHHDCSGTSSSNDRESSRENSIPASQPSSESSTSSSSRAKPGSQSHFPSDAPVNSEPTELPRQVSLDSIEVSRDGLCKSDEAASDCSGKADSDRVMSTVSSQAPSAMGVVPKGQKLTKETNPWIQEQAAQANVLLQKYELKEKKAKHESTEEKPRRSQRRKSKDRSKIEPNSNQAKQFTIAKEPLPTISSSRTMNIQNPPMPSNLLGDSMLCSKDFMVMNPPAALDISSSGSADNLDSHGSAKKSPSPEDAEDKKPREPVSSRASLSTNLPSILSLLPPDSLFRMVAGGPRFEGPKGNDVNANTAFPSEQSGHSKRSATKSSDANASSEITTGESCRSKGSSSVNTSVLLQQALNICSSEDAHSPISGEAPVILHLESDKRDQDSNAEEFTEQLGLRPDNSTFDSLPTQVADVPSRTDSKPIARQAAEEDCAETDPTNAGISNKSDGRWDKWHERRKQKKERMNRKRRGSGYGDWLKCQSDSYGGMTPAATPARNVAKVNNSKYASASSRAASSGAASNYASRASESNESDSSNRFSSAESAISMASQLSQPAENFSHRSNDEDDEQVKIETSYRKWQAHEAKQAAEDRPDAKKPPEHSRDSEEFTI